MRLKYKLITAISLFTLSVNALALETAFNLGISFGGDTLVTYTDGTTLGAGDGLSFDLDLAQAINESMFLTSSVGFKFKTQKVSGGSVDLNSTPITLGVKYKLNKKIGFSVGGITQLSSNFSVLSSSTTLSSNIGIYAELLYKMNRKLELGFRSVSGLTSTSDSTNLEIDASHFTLNMRSYF